MTLGEQLLALHEAFDDSAIPHAFGGAIALAYWTLDPRGTSDLDVNVFVPSAACEPALSALPRAVTRPPDTARRVREDGQVRLWWDDTPLDLFFDYEPIHRDAALHCRLVPFAGSEIPVLGPVELAVFKVIFDRTRDWADIEAMLAAGTVAPEQIRTALVPLLPASDERFARLEEAVRRSAS